MAASVKDVKFSLEGEQTKESVFKEPTRESFNQPSLEAAPPAASKRVIFKLAKKRNGRYWMSGIADLYNPKTKKIERARLITGVDTIWMKEQKDVEKDYAAKNIRSLCFEDGSLILNGHDETAIEFARCANGCLDNINKKTGAKQEYYEWNPAKQEAEAFQREIDEQEAMELAMLQTYDKVKKHASFLGNISFVDEMGEPRSEKGVRTLYVREARRNPSRFKKTLDSKEVEVAYLVKRGILDSKIDTSTSGVKWANGGNICHLPQGRQAYEYLLEFALLPNEEGRLFLEHLQKNVV